MKMLFYILLFSKLAYSESFSSGLSISGDGLEVNNTPIKVQRSSNGDLKANFSVTKMLSGAGSAETSLPINSNVIASPKSDVLIDSDTFFKGVGENKQGPNSPGR